VLSGGVVLDAHLDKFEAIMAEAQTNVALVVRNTFLDIDEPQENQQSTRSNSAPPTCRHKGDYESAAISTTYESTTEASDGDDCASMVSWSSNTEHEDVSPPMTSYNSDSDCETPWHNPAPVRRQNPHSSGRIASQPAPGQLTEVAAQQQLEQMSQMVMDIWAKLREVESAVDAQCEEAVTAASESKKQVDVKLDAKAQPFKPSCSKPSEVQVVMGSVKEAVMPISGVAGVDVSMGPAGTLATISIQLESTASKSKVLQTSKSALLEAAASSESTYVMGYEAQPFQDDIGGSSFTAVLASCPPAWECSACWDTYTKGICPRPRACKWQHPGRNELQPIRIILC
jgi:hypothetical protein